MDRDRLTSTEEKKIATKIIRKSCDQYDRRLAAIKAIDASALSGEALRAKSEEFRRRLAEAELRRIG
jgi:hypothetical protein